MATTGKIEGGVLTLYKDISGTDTKFACLTEVTWDTSADEIDVTCHESTGRYGDFEAGRISESLSFSGYYDQSSSNYTFDDMYTDYKNGTTITATLTTAETGDTEYIFTAKFTSLNLAVPNKGDFTTFSGSLRVTGAPTVQTVS